MKTLFYTFLSSILTVLPLNTVLAQVSGTGLIAYYPMRSGDVINNGSANGLVENLASNQYHMTPSASLSFVVGRNGAATNSGNGALALSGGQHLAYNYSGNAAPFQQTVDFAVGAWAATTAPSFTNEYQNIVVVGNTDIFLRYRKSGTSYSIQAGIRYNTTQFSVINYSIVSPNNFFEDTWGNPKWHHFTLLRYNGALELYIDGVHSGGTSNNQAITHSGTNQTFKVGRGVDPNTHLNGKISDVFYYDRALFLAEFARFTCDQTNASPNTTAVDNCGPAGGALNSNLPAGAASYSWYTTPFDGAAVHTGNGFLTGMVSTTTTYYVDATYTGGCLQKSYPRAKVVMNINSPAVAPTNTTPAANLSICAGTATTLTATTTNNSIAWYDAPTGGNLLGAGNSYNTYTLFGTTTFYAASISPGCGSSTRTPIQVTVSPNTQPAAPTIITSVLTTCGNTAFTLIANTPGTTIRWYDAPSGGTLLSTGTNYVTPVLPNPSAFGVEDTYTYYVESSTTCGGSSARVPVTVTVKYQYALTAVNPNITVCQGETAVLQINTPSPQSTTIWNEMFSVVATNTYFYTTPTINSNTSITATIQPSNGCAASVNFNITMTTTQVVAPINTTLAGNQVICSGSTAQLSASAASTIYWYDEPTNGTLLSTGNNFTTSALTGNTTFYAQQGSGICASNRIAVLVTVNQPTTGIATHSACGSFTWIDGNFYNSSNNTATHVIPGGNVNGCDSIVTLNLTILQPATGIATHTECGSFTWIDGNTYNSSNSTATHTIANGAVNGCDSIVTLNLTITTPPVTGVDVQASCGPFTWIDGNTYTFTTNAVTHTIPGGAANGCDSIVTLNLTVTDILNTTYLVGNTLSTNQNLADYQWVDCDNGNDPISGATNQSFTPTVSGNYAVEITLNGCTQLSPCTNVTISTSGIEEQTTAAFYMFPNPAKESVTINNLTIGSKLQLVDMTGKIVLESSVSASEMTLDLNTVNNGIYFVHIHNNSHIVASKKLIISK